MLDTSQGQAVAGPRERMRPGTAFGEQTDIHMSSSMGEAARAAGEGQPCPLPPDSTLKP